jgi:hypothetical protein
MPIRRSLALLRARRERPCRRAAEPWRTPQRIAEDTERAAEPPLSEDPREDAYLKYKIRMANAWRGAR